MTKFIVAYFVIINTVGFMLMSADKERAKANAWRIPEKTLLGVAALGGSLGVLVAMNSLRHKTKHWYFQYGVPFMFVLQCAVAFSWYYSLVPSK